MNAQGLNDKEIGQDILTGHKYLTDLYAQGGIEAADPKLRQLMGRLHGESANDAGRVFEHMYQRGWYGLRAAESQDINEMRSNIGQTRQSLAMSAGQTMAQGATAESTMASGVNTSSLESQQRFGGISGMMGQGYQQQPNFGHQQPLGQSGYSQYGGGMQHNYGGNLPTWTRQEVPGESGQIASGGPVGYSSYPGGPTTYFSGGPQQGYGINQASYQQQQGLSGNNQMGYGSNLPTWTRQEVPGESGQVASGGPVGYSSYPGGPTTYFSGGPQQGFGQGSYQQQQGFSGNNQMSYGSNLPIWTRQEVPGESGQRASGGPVGYSSYPGGPTTYFSSGPQQSYGINQSSYQQHGYGGNLPTWTRQEVPGESGQRASGGPVGYSSYPGGPTTYFSGGPQQSQGINQSSYQQQNQQLPSWTRQEVGQQGNFGGMQQQQMGQQPYRSSYSGYGQLPSWTRQEVQSGYGHQLGGQMGYSGQMGGSGVSQGGGMGIPQQSLYGSQNSQGFGQSQSR